jgi:hypothetical protein
MLCEPVPFVVKYIDNFKSETQRMQQNARALAFQRITAISKYNPSPKEAARG